jgi:Tol biopolymer transport system component/tRNA A-37 threonylcarbamoyl transferase component Bud32
MVSPGTRLGPYEIGSVIGVGGMGKVYRARDTRLNRDVAVKVLPDALAHDAGRSGRLLREARVLASLNHPNIAAIHGLEESADGVRALVLELVEGPTVADLIANPALHDSSSGDAHPSDGTATSSGTRRSADASQTVSLATTLSVARQIAEALEAAHELDVVHRDLKPANVKVRPDGTVKVLDFGLAKALVEAETSAGSVDSTLTLATREGTILGTPAYMSPEQARGRPVDKRTDIWAFGCILYEMLTRRRAFDGDHPAEMIAAVLERSPDFDALPQATPPAIRRLLRLCLEKDWKRRLPDIAVARLEIDEALAGTDDAPAGAVPVAGPRRASPWRERAAWLIALVAAGGAVALYPLSRGGSDAELLRFEIDTPPTSDAFAFALSPDGRQLVFVAASDDTPLLWVRPLDQVAAQPLSGTERASYPFWSANGRAVGFFADGKLKRKDLTGGPPQELADAPSPRGGAWNQDGDIVFAAEATGGLMRVAETGGPPTVVTALAADHGSHRWPQFLPDGRRFLFFVGLGQEGARGVYLGSLDGSAPARVLAGETAALFAPPDHLLRVVRDVLVVHRFDPARGTADPTSRPVAQMVGTDDGAFHSAFSVSATGLLAHRPGVGTARQLVWFDRAGTPLATLGAIDGHVPSSPELGRDGRRLALSRAPEGTGDIWLIDDVERNTARRMTFDPGVDAFPVLSPDGAALIFSSGRNGRLDLFEKASTGVGDEHPVLSSGHDKVPNDWSPDGQYLLYTDQDPTTGSDLWAVSIEVLRGEGAALRDDRGVAVVRSGFDEGQGRFSPDGRWIAYVSNETGRQEVYVQPFPGPGGKTTISTEGGIYPRWHPDGAELFYVGLDMRLMAVTVGTSPSGSFEPDDPRALVPTRIATSGPYVLSAGIFARAQYAVAADGRFLVNVAEDVAAPPITLVANWPAGLAD